ncbi:hypothetical protein MNBD_GAMMA12-2860 [hydrothermal vent metagenome]|uniref:Uncharacterized protein n=1 Tax=hydrothermal vent metagenome TaxID=652676 RepID=A0A3B0YUQ8_9ZZZZ
MPRYIITQVVAVLTIMTGWSILVGGSTLTYLWIDKAIVIAVLPATAAMIVNALPNYVFLIPTVCVFIIGLVIAAIGHILHVSLANAAYPVDDVVVAENRRNSYDF